MLQFWADFIDRLVPAGNLVVTRASVWA
jgi:hypothetical protein